MGQLLTVLQSNPVLIGASITAMVAATIGVFTVRSANRARSVQALLQIYALYQSEDETIRRKLADGLNTEEPASLSEADFRSLYNYMGRLEFLAILIRSGFVREPVAREIFSKAPEVVIDKTRAFVRLRRQVNKRFAKRLEEWVALGRRKGGRFFPGPIYLWWYWKFGPGKPIASGLEPKPLPTPVTPLDALDKVVDALQQADSGLRRLLLDRAEVMAHEESAVTAMGLAAGQIRELALTLQKIADPPATT